MQQSAIREAHKSTCTALRWCPLSLYFWLVRLLIAAAVYICCIWMLTPECTTESHHTPVFVPSHHCYSIALATQNPTSCSEGHDSAHRAHPSMTLLELNVSGWFFFFLQQCLLCSNGLCVSGPGVGIILETGSWQSPGVDFWGEDGIRFIPISLVINQKGQLVVVAGEMFCKWYILQVWWERCSFQFHDLHKCLSNYLASN